MFMTWTLAKKTTTETRFHPFAVFLSPFTVHTAKASFLVSPRCWPLEFIIACCEHFVLPAAPVISYFRQTRMQYKALVYCDCLAVVRDRESFQLVYLVGQTPFSKETKE